MRTITKLLLTILMLSNIGVALADTAGNTNLCSTHAQEEWEKITAGYQFEGEYNSENPTCNTPSGNTATSQCTNTCIGGVLPGLETLSEDALRSAKKEYQQCVDEAECSLRQQKAKDCEDKIKALRQAHCTLYMTNLAYEERVCLATEAAKQDATKAKEALQEADKFKADKLTVAQTKYTEAIQAFNNCQMEKGADETLSKEINTYRRALVSIEQLLYSKASIDTSAMGTTKNLTDYVPYVISILLGLAGTTAIVTIVIAGFMMVMSAANPDLQKKAKSTLVSAVIGLGFVFGAYLLVRFVQSLL